MHSRTLCLLLAFLTAACAPPGDGDGVPHWGYEADDGPAQWAEMSPQWALCATGTEQSPIDLADWLPTRLPNGELQTPSAQEVEVLNQAGVVGTLDNGHTIQVNAKTGETMTIGEDSYALVQMHFHAPSEHTLDGNRFPMEMHLVHQAADGALAVVGTFIEEGEANPGIDTIWASLGAPDESPAAVTIPADFADALFPVEESGIFHYQGSLTTPPCSEGVKWYIRSTPSQFSKQQIETFTSYYDHNNRPVQPVNDRTVYVDTAPSAVIR